MTYLIEITNAIAEKRVTIGVIGLGYVGLPLVIRFCEEKFNVIGFDIDPLKINKLNSGKSYIEHISSEKVNEICKNNFFATNDFSNILKTDVIIICVPTPLSKQREPDLTFIENTINSILPYLKRGQIISLESTTYPGNTDEVLKPMLESTGFKIGNDLYLIFSPEREDPGNKNFNTFTIPKVVGGITKNCLELGIALYQSIIKTIVPVSSTKAAEMTKLLENIHRAVNIGLVNEMKIVADKMGVNIHEVIHAASTKPFGFTPFFPGPGLGGHCIPIDPFYLTWKAREYGIHTKFIELAGEINNSMPEWVVSKISDALNNSEKSIRGSQILILGIAYKKNVDDMRESPAVIIMEKLRSKGAILSYSDPHVPQFPIMREHKFELESLPLSAEVLNKFDCVILTTDHDKFDYDLIKDNSKLIVDTRGKYKNFELNVVKA